MASVQQLINWRDDQRREGTAEASAESAHEEDTVAATTQVGNGDITLMGERAEDQGLIDNTTIPLEMLSQASPLPLSHNQWADSIVQTPGRAGTQTPGGRRKLPSVPPTPIVHPNHPTPICPNHPTPHRPTSPNVVTPATTAITDELVALRTMLLEVREVVQGNSAAVKDLKAKVDNVLHQQTPPHVQQTITATSVPSSATQQTITTSRVDMANHDGAFQYPKRTAPQRSTQQSVLPLPVENRYTPLLVEDLPILSNDNDAEQINPQAPPRQPRNNRRPNICCSLNHLNNFHPIRPGTSTYAGSTSQGRRVFVLSDSMLQRIRKKEFNANLRNGWAQIKPFPGANSKYLHHHVLPHLIEEHPHTLVIHGGTNDLRNRDKTASQIADDLISIALTATSFGTEHIIFSSIITRQDGVTIDRKRKEVNRLLRDMCTFYDFYFIDNDNIQFSDIDSDRVHMCESGSVKLANNILNVLNVSR